MRSLAAAAAAALFLASSPLVAQSASFQPYGAGCVATPSVSSCLSVNPTGAFEGRRAARYLHAIPFTTGNAPVNLRGVDLTCRTASGRTLAVPVYVYTSSQGRPAANILRGSIRATATVQKHRVLFSTIRTLAARTQYFLVLDNRYDLFIPTVKTGSVVPHYLYSSGWRGAYRTYRWSFELLCYRNVPLQSATGLPKPGSVFTVRLDRAQPAALSMWAVGARPWNLDLYRLGAPGCRLLINPAGMILVNRRTDYRGSTGLSFRVPTNRSLIGVRLFSQFAVRAPGNALGLQFSNGAAILVGN